MRVSICVPMPHSKAPHKYAPSFVRVYRQQLSAPFPLPSCDATQRIGAQHIPSGITGLNRSRAKLRRWFWRHARGAPDCVCAVRYATCGCCVYDAHVGDERLASSLNHQMCACAHGSIFLDGARRLNEDNFMA